MSTPAPTLFNDTTTTTFAPQPSNTDSPVALVTTVLTRDAFEQLFCSWTTMRWLCFLTWVPIFLWAAVVITIVVVLCLRTATAKEYQRLQDWTETNLVPESIKGLTRRRRERIFRKLRTISLQKFFSAVNLDPAFAESCAAVGIATLGDLLYLRPVFLRDLGFGVTEKQQILRSVERRAQYVEDWHRNREQEVVTLPSGVATDIEAACASNRGDVHYFLVKPNEGSIRQHAEGADWLQRDSPSILRSLNDPSATTTSLMLHDVLSEQVSRIFWDYFRAEFAQWPAEGIRPPLISIAADNRRSARVSKEFYLRCRKRWDEARRRLLFIRVSFVSTYKRICVKHAPVSVLANEQFWLGFVLRWSLQQERLRKQRELERAKREAKERLKAIAYEATRAVSKITKEAEEAAAHGSLAVVHRVAERLTAVPGEVVKRIEGLMSPISRLLRARNAQTSEAATRVRTDDGQGNAQRPHRRGHRTPHAGEESDAGRTTEGESSGTDDWDMVEAPQDDDASDDGYASDRDRIGPAARGRRINALAASGEEGADDAGDVVHVDDDMVSPEEMDRAELLELDPFVEGWEVQDTVATECETFSVSVQLGRFLAGDEYEGSQFIMDNVKLSKMMQSHQREDDVLEELAREVEYSTSVEMWNHYVHEFQEGEMGIVMPPVVRRHQSTTSPGTRSNSDEKHEGSSRPSAEGRGDEIGEEEMVAVPASATPQRDALVPSATDYSPPPNRANVTSDFVVHLHIVSVINTSERFNEIRRRLMLMRGEQFLDSDGTAAARDTSGRNTPAPITPVRRGGGSDEADVGSDAEGQRQSTSRRGGSPSHTRSPVSARSSGSRSPDRPSPMLREGDSTARPNMSAAQWHDTNEDPLDAAAERPTSSRPPRSSRSAVVAEGAPSPTRSGGNRFRGSLARRQSLAWKSTLRAPATARTNSKRLSVDPQTL